MSEPLIVTHQAAAKVWELIEEEGNFDLKLRVYVTGGGCSGLQYGFTFDEVVNADDTSVIKGLDDSKHSIQVLVDAMSFQYLVGAEIDYLEDLDGARFIIRNPNATTKCGCGSSFAVE
ncbi:MAG: iron-sulfur cluster insertion protein ErpA [Pseudomonadota bacterium]